MAYAFRKLGDNHEILLSGSLTSLNKAVVRELIDKFNDLNGHRCVLAMEKLNTIDFYGLEMLILLSDMAKAQGLLLTIRQPYGQVKEMIKLSNLDKIIPIEA